MHWRLRRLAPTLDQILREPAPRVGSKDQGRRRQTMAPSPWPPPCAAPVVSRLSSICAAMPCGRLGGAAREWVTSAEALGEEAGLGLGGPSCRKAALDLDGGAPQAREKARQDAPGLAQ